MYISPTKHVSSVLIQTEDELSPEENVIPDVHSHVAGIPGVDGHHVTVDHHHSASSGGGHEIAVDLWGGVFEKRRQVSRIKENKRRGENNGDAKLGVGTPRTTLSQISPLHPLTACDRRRRTMWGGGEKCKERLALAIR